MKTRMSPLLVCPMGKVNVQSESGLLLSECLRSAGLRAPGFAHGAGGYRSDRSAPRPEAAGGAARLVRAGGRGRGRAARGPMERPGGGALVSAPGSHPAPAGDLDRTTLVQLR